LSVFWTRRRRLPRLPTAPAGDDPAIAGNDMAECTATMGQARRLEAFPPEEVAPMGENQVTFYSKLARFWS
jgi:hypothetical protein